MAHCGLLGEYRFSETIDDIRGRTLYGSEDEKLGKIDDVIFDHSSGDILYVVVDTGGWLRTKKFIVPADRLWSSPQHENAFGSNLTKKQVEAFPPYDARDLDSADKWKDYEGRYRAKWESGPVMHRAENDRNITPTTHQMQGTGPTTQALDKTPISSSTERVVPAGVDSVVISNSAVGIGGRWDTFQARLRERRKEAVAGCSTCTVGPATEKGAESADTFKKAV